MLDHKNKISCLVLGIILFATLTRASIENSPVRVTHRNSGPRYDFEDVENVERNRMANGEGQSGPQDNQIAPPRSPTNAVRPPQDMPADTPIGHLSIRRIFLVPMMGPMHSDAGQWSGSDKSNDQVDNDSSGSSNREQPGMVGGSSKPFWPFVPPTRHHILGGDEASRSPTVEREDTLPERPTRPLFDPIQMMIDMMQQALSQSAMGHPSEIFGDLNKEASGAPTSKSDDKTQDAAQPDANNNKPTELGQPIKPTSNNETREDIVEIEGKKYLRKTVINRHVGENVIFMTKRLIFTPLNETDSEQTTTTTTTTTTVAPPAVSSSEGSRASVSSEVPETIKDDALKTSTTTSSPVEPASSESPSTSAPLSTEAVETPSSTPVNEASTSKESWVERVSEAIAEKIAEAVEPSSTTTTAKPAV